jgi:hypothetical protein
MLRPGMKRLGCFTVYYLIFNVSNTGQTSVPSHAFARMCLEKVVL